MKVSNVVTLAVLLVGVQSLMHAATRDQEIKRLADEILVDAELLAIDQELAE